jgi:hypothetical protein
MWQHGVPTAPFNRNPKLAQVSIDAGIIVWNRGRIDTVNTCCRLADLAGATLTTQTHKLWQTSLASRRGRLPGR